MYMFKKKIVKNNLYSLHIFIPRNTIITISSNKLETLVTKLTTGTLVPLLSNVNMVTAITRMANVLAVQSKWSIPSFVFS
jgi:hypothetical protein